VTSANWKNWTLTGTNTMPKTDNQAKLFSIILSIEDLQSEIKDGTVSPNETCAHLNKVHAMLCRMVSNPSLIPAHDKEN
jgi:hypothetical protein